jgi:hypothetical protein
LTCSLPICFPFISFSCLIALAKNSNITLSKSGKSGCPSLAHYLRENVFSFSPVRVMLAVCLSYVAFSHTELWSFFC